MPVIATTSGGLATTIKAAVGGNLVVAVKQ